MLSHPTFKVNYIPELRLHSVASQYMEKCLGMLLKAIEVINKNDELEKRTANTDCEANDEREFDVNKLITVLFSKCHYTAKTTLENTSV